MRAQLTSVADRLGAVAKDLRAQAEAQRTASAGDSSIAASPGGGSRPRTSLQQELAEMRRMRAEQLMRLARANSWAEDIGRQQIRDLADASEAEQRAWWDRLTDDQRAALLRNDPGALFGLEGLPADVRAEARADYIDSVRSDLEISSTEDKLTGELNIAWVHLGVEGSAGIVEQADGTYRVDLALDGEIGANLGSKGAKGHAGIGAGVAQSYEFDSLAEAEAFVAGLYEKLTPDVDLSVFAGPGAVMADTVEDVVGYLGDHSDQRTSFEGELRLEGEVDLDVGAFEVNVSGEAGAPLRLRQPRDDAVPRRLGLRAASTSRRPVEGTTASAELSADLEVAAGRSTTTATSASSASAARSAARRRSASRRSSTAPTPTRRRRRRSACPPPVAPTSASTPRSTCRTRSSSSGRRTLLNSMSSGGVSLSDLQALLRESEVQVQVDATNNSSDSGTSASPAWRSSRAGSAQRLHLGQARRRRLHPRRGRRAEGGPQRCLSPSTDRLTQVYRGDGFRFAYPAGAARRARRRRPVARLGRARPTASSRCSSPSPSRSRRSPPRDLQVPGLLGALVSKYRGQGRLRGAVVRHGARRRLRRAEAAEFRYGAGDPRQVLIVAARIAGPEIVTLQVHFPPSTADENRPLALGILESLDRRPRRRRPGGRPTTAGTSSSPTPPSRPTTT